MLDPQLDPTSTPVEKLRVEPAETPALDQVELKRRIAELVRADSLERAAPTQEDAVLALAAELPRERLGELLSEMSAEPAFKDVKAVVTPSGRIYLFSEAHLAREAAAERCLVEEAKVAIAEKVRQDSQYLALTPLGELDRFFPSPEPERRAALIAELRAEERFKDIQEITGANGEVCLHSDAHLSGNYGKIMMRAQARNPGLSIAEFVRDRSRVAPAPTPITIFQDRVFGLSQEEVDAFLHGLASAEPGSEFADIRRLVHPTTGAVYLYSDRWLGEPAAWRVMDWDEVGAAQNP